MSKILAVGITIIDIINIDNGYSSVADFLIEQQGKLKSKLLSSTCYNDKLYLSNQFKSDNIMYTLAAGDTYNAALIHALLKNKELGYRTC